MTDQFDGEKDPVVAEGDRGRVEDAVTGRREADEAIERAEKDADAELARGAETDGPDDPAVDQTDRFRN